MRAVIGQYDPRHPEDGLQINFDEDDLERLAVALRRALPVMTGDEDGAFLVTPIDGQASAESVNAIMSALKGNPKIIEALAAQGGLNELHETISHLGRLATLKHAIAELEAAVARRESSEAVYQKWCERNSWAFGFIYVGADDLHTISRTDKVDLLLQRTFGGYRDLVELKTPTVKVLEKVRHFYTLSKPASEALGQALHYASRLQHLAYYQSGLQDAEDIRAHRPHTVVVIGSSAGWSNEMKQAWHQHNTALSDVQLWTFEDLIACGRRAIDVLSG